jgi:hypothetical protein
MVLFADGNGVRWPMSRLFQRAHSSTFIVSESLFPTRSHGEYYLKVRLRVLVESTSRVSPTHYPRWHPCKSQPAKSKSQPANAKVIRQLAGQNGYVNKPDHDVQVLYIMLTSLNMMYKCWIRHSITLHDQKFWK